jgi:hypothetical protein
MFCRCNASHEALDVIQTTFKSFMLFMVKT